MRNWVIIIAAALALGACAGSRDQRMVGDAAIGGVSGAVVGGPVGAAVGAGAGAVVGAAGPHYYGYHRYHCHYSYRLQRRVCHYW